MILRDLVMVFVNQCKLNVAYIYFFLINGYHVNTFPKWLKSNRIAWAYTMMSWKSVPLSFKLGTSLIIHVHIKQVIVRQVIWNLIQAEYYLNITCACVKYIYYQNELKIKVLKMIEFFLMKHYVCTEDTTHVSKRENYHCP